MRPGRARLEGILEAVIGTAAVAEGTISPGANSRFVIWADLHLQVRHMEYPFSPQSLAPNQVGLDTLRSSPGKGALPDKEHSPALFPGG